jgi:serine/threonine protein phosphatase PrpC
MIIVPTSLSSKKQTSLLIGNVSGLWGASQKQQRASEDRFQAVQIGQFRYFAIFDGHGGSKRMGRNHVADYCVNHLHENLANALDHIDLCNQNDVSEIIKQVFIDFDREMYTLNKSFGSTCTMILIDDQRNIIYQVNIGDSRSIIFNDDSIISVTEDHNPTHFNEKKRVEEAGGYVAYDRVNGILILSRAFGDFDYLLKANNNNMYDPINGKISALPDIKITAIQKPMYVLLTSDSPYERDIFTDKSLIELFRTMDKEILITQPNRLNIIVENMVEVISNKSTDDTTIILVNI